jgi:hypothetical protein
LKQGKGTGARRDGEQWVKRARAECVGTGAGRGSTGGRLSSGLWLRGGQRIKVVGAGGAGAGRGGRQGRATIGRRGEAGRGRGGRDKAGAAGRVGVAFKKGNLQKPGGREVGADCSRRGFYERCGGSGAACAARLGAGGAHHETLTSSLSLKREIVKS